MLHVRRCKTELSQAIEAMIASETAKILNKLNAMEGRLSAVERQTAGIIDIIGIIRSTVVWANLGRSLGPWNDLAVVGSAKQNVIA